MYTKIINPTIKLPILFFFSCLCLLIGTASELKADRTFNIQIESPSISTDSLHSKPAIAKDLLASVFTEEEEITEVQYQVFDMDDKIVFEGSEDEWLYSENQNLEVIKRKAEFFFFTDNTKIYKVFSPISYQKANNRKKTAKAKKLKKNKSTFKKRSKRKKSDRAKLKKNS